MFTVQYLVLSHHQRERSGQTAAVEDLFRMRTRKEQVILWRRAGAEAT